jgi:hypothetical protein
VPQQNWSTKLADFVAYQGRPEFREPARRVIHELDRFDNPEAINSIAPMDAAGAIGIGINHQRKTWFLLGALLFFGLLAIMAFTMPFRLRDANGDLSAWVIILPMFGGFGTLFVLLYLKKPGPEAVVVANSTSLYVVARTGLRLAPKESLVAWAEEQVMVELATVTHNGVTTHTVALMRKRRDGGFKRALFRTRIDPQGFGYWEQFSEAIARFM